MVETERDCLQCNRGMPYILVQIEIHYKLFLPPSCTPDKAFLVLKNTEQFGIQRTKRVSPPENLPSNVVLKIYTRPKADIEQGFEEGEKNLQRSSGENWTRGLSF